MSHTVEVGPASAAGPPSLNGCIPFRGATQNFVLPGRQSPPPALGLFVVWRMEIESFVCKEGTNDPEQTRTFLKLSGGQETVQDLQRKHDRGEADQTGCNKGKWWKKQSKS